MHTMRTNIVIDDALMTEALAVSCATTKREVVELALRALIRLQAQEELKSLRGKIDWQADLKAMRLD
jgi:Arc/MetJ family transcription regulator